MYCLILVVAREVAESKPGIDFLADKKEKYRKDMPLMKKLQDNQ